MFDLSVLINFLASWTPTSIQLGTVYVSLICTTDVGPVEAETHMVLTINVFKSC
jgi:hypothetical protein